MIIQEPKKSRVIGSNLVSNVLAGMALIISLSTLIYTWKSDKKKEREILEITTERLQTDEKIAFYKGYPDLIMPTYWSCNLTNNGEKTLSIVSYDVKRLYRRDNLMYYSNIDLGLYTQRFQKLQLPINIDPGESQKILVKVGVSLYKNASDILRQNLDSIVVYQFQDINRILAKNNVDIFDNKVEGDEFLSIQWENPNPNKDYYTIGFKTGKGKDYVDLLLWYPSIK